jgi:proteasome lid subunit RPN8/RPN11
MLLPADLSGQIVSLAEITYPFEACGLLIGQQIDQTVVVEQITYGGSLASTAFESTAQSRGSLPDLENFLAADRTVGGADHEIVGVWHSHPDTPAQPLERRLHGHTLQDAWADYSYLIVSVSAMGCAELRSWRLLGERFLEERLR